MKISIIIPAFNEEKRITNTLKTINTYLNTKKMHHEIILVDDGSQDTTMQTALATRIPLQLLRNQTNQGKGTAVKQGMLAAKGDYALFSDADLSTPIEELDNFIPWTRKGFDIIIGSRAVTGADIQLRQPFYRELIGKIFNKIVRILTIRSIHDTQCGFKLFTKKAARDIFKQQQLNGFAFDVETLYIAQKKGYRIKELPVVWRNSRATKVKPLKDALSMFIDLARIRINDLRGLYD